MANKKKKNTEKHKSRPDSFYDDVAAIILYDDDDGNTYEEIIRDPETVRQEELEKLRASKKRDKEKEIKQYPNQLIQTIQKTEIMETTENTNAGNDRKPARKQRKNQIIYIEYENPREDGHKITVMDNFRNVIGRINEIYDEQSGKFEYTFNDHEGNQKFKSEKLENLKEEISKNKAVMMEQAHQRRIEKNAEKAIAQSNPFQQKNQGKSKMQVGKKVEAIVERTNKEAREITGSVHDFVGGHESEREKEMRELRERKQQNKTRDLGR